MKPVLPALLLAAIFLQAIYVNPSAAQIKKMQPAAMRTIPVSAVTLKPDSIRAFLNRNKPYNIHNIPAVEVSRQELLNEIKMRNTDSIVIVLVRDTMNENSIVTWDEGSADIRYKIKIPLPTPFCFCCPPACHNEIYDFLKVITVDHHQIHVAKDSIPALYRANLNAGNNKLLAAKFAKRDAVAMLNNIPDKNITMLFSLNDRNNVEVAAVTQDYICHPTPDHRCCPPDCLVMKIPYQTSPNQ